MYSLKNGVNHPQGSLRVRVGPGHGCYSYRAPFPQSIQTHLACMQFHRHGRSEIWSVRSASLWIKVFLNISKYLQDWHKARWWAKTSVLCSFSGNVHTFFVVKRETRCTPLIIFVWWTNKRKKKPSKGELWASELSGVFKVKVNSFQPLQARHGVILANTGIGGAIL